MCVRAHIHVYICVQSQCFFFHSQIWDFTKACSIGSSKAIQNHEFLSLYKKKKIIKKIYIHMSLIKLPNLKYLHFHLSSRIHFHPLFSSIIKNVYLLIYIINVYLLYIYRDLESRYCILAGKVQFRPASYINIK